MTNSSPIQKHFGIDYLLFSEFDIDKGAVVRQQYPSHFPYANESELSAQMLPDGSHNCTEDTSIFLFRHLGSSPPLPPSSSSKPKQQQQQRSTHDGSPPPIKKSSSSSSRTTTSAMETNNNKNVLLLNTPPVKRPNRQSTAAASAITLISNGSNVMTDKQSSSSSSISSSSSSEENVVEKEASISNNSAVEEKGEHDSEDDSDAYEDAEDETEDSEDDDDEEEEEDGENDDEEEEEEGDDEEQDTLELEQESNTVVYYGLNIYKQKKIENIRRGARVKSVAVISRDKSCCFALKPLLSQVLEMIFAMYDHERKKMIRMTTMTTGVASSDAQMTDQAIYDRIMVQLNEFMAHVYDHINHKINVSSLPVYNDTQRLVWRFSLPNQEPRYETIHTILRYHPTNPDAYQPNDTEIELRVPVLLLDNEISFIYEKKKKNANSFMMFPLSSDLSSDPPQSDAPKTPVASSKKSKSPSSSRTSSFDAQYNNIMASPSSHHSRHSSMDELKKRKEKFDSTKASLVNLIQLFGEKTMIIFNAILYGKSVMFMANNKNAGFVTPYVMSSLLLHPQLPHLLSHRTFPYVSFMNMDWLNEKNNGYVVGVTNPIFASKDEYFDFLCEIETGKIVVSTFEKTRLQQKQYTTHSKSKTKRKHAKIKSARKHRRKHKRKHSGIPSTDEIFGFNPEDPMNGSFDGGMLSPNHSRASSLEDSSSHAAHSGGADHVDEHHAGGIGAGMGMISDAVTGTLSSASNSGIVSSMTVQVAENDDVFYMTSKDSDFIRKVMHLISENQKKKVPREETEEAVRVLFYDYSTSIMELAFDMKQRILYQKKQYYRSLSSYDKKSSDDEEPDENVLKTFTWRLTKSFKLYAERRLLLSKNRLIAKEVEVTKWIHTLTHSSNLDEEQIITIFQKFIRNIHTRDELLEFLSYLPECRGGISPIAHCIFHTSLAVRVVVVAFLRRFEQQNLLQQLNPFLMVTYVRNAKLLLEE